MCFADLYAGKGMLNENDVIIFSLAVLSTAGSRRLMLLYPGTILRRRGAGEFFEVGDEVICIFIAHFVTYFMYFQICFREKIFCGLNPHSVEVLQGRGVKMILEFPADSVFILFIFQFQLIQCVFSVILRFKF